MTITISLQDRYRGALLGLAAGDALGTTLEFQAPGTFTPMTDMVGGGVFGLKAGQWTDDTSMALCLAESLLESKGFNPWDQLDRYVRWWQDGYLSSTGRCFDIGGQTRSALQAFLTTDLPYATGDRSQAGNGALMRLVPAVLAYRAKRSWAITAAGRSSWTTHRSQISVDACRAYGAMILMALHGASKEALLDPKAVRETMGRFKLGPEVADVVDGSYRHKKPPEIRGTGYVVASLEAALWAFVSSDNFRDGALLAANLGEDADTTAAIFGQLAGAYYGVEAIPHAWRDRLAMRELIVDLADRLLALSEGEIAPVPEPTIQRRDVFLNPPFGTPKPREPREPMVLGDDAFQLDGGINLAKHLEDLEAEEKRAKKEKKSKEAGYYPIDHSWDAPMPDMKASWESHKRSMGKDFEL